MESDASDRSKRFPSYDFGIEVSLKIEMWFATGLYCISPQRVELKNVTFESFQDRCKVCVAFTLGENLQTVVMVPNIFLVDAQHRQKHIEQITWKIQRRH